MTEDLSVVLASNRGPLSFVRAGGGFTTKGAAGGASPALDAVARRLGPRAVWIAATISEADREAVASGAADSLADQLGYPFYFLSIDPDTYSRYYNEVSNRMLWFANHCLWDEVAIDRFGDQELDAWQNAYEPVNLRFARAVAEAADPSALVLFQDYHLSTAPGHLRELRPKQTILHFTHSSFCGPEGLDRLPRPIPQRVIHGMLGADLVGFHVGPWVHAFFECCERAGAKVDRDGGTVHHDGRSTWVRAYPIPIDAPDLKARAEKTAATEWARRFTTWARGRSLIVRADRAEPSKNIIRGFEAFGMMLDNRPALVDKVCFAACLYPSREGMPEYLAYSDAISARADEVNARHPGSIEIFMQDDFDRTLGAYRVYDVLLVNSLMDGMNLVSKEGPAVNERDGALVLSRSAGSYTELGEHAVEIEDPRDVGATARALERALEMPPDERRRHADALRARTVSARPSDWINAQIDDLREIQSGRDPRSSPTI